MIDLWSSFNGFFSRVRLSSVGLIAFLVSRVLLLKVLDFMKLCMLSDLLKSFTGDLRSAGMWRA